MGIDLQPSEICQPWHKKFCLVWMMKHLLSFIWEHSCQTWWLTCGTGYNVIKSCICIFFLLCWHLATWPFPFLHGSLFSQFQAYLQGCVFCVFSLLCLIDSNKGFLNGLSSDLFPQELMTQNDFKDEWWVCKSLWSETTGFVVIYPPDTNQHFKDG